MCVDVSARKNDGLNFVKKARKQRDDMMDGHDVRGNRLVCRAGRGWWFVLGSDLNSEDVTRKNRQKNKDKASRR